MVEKLKYSFAMQAVYSLGQVRARYLVGTASALFLSEVLSGRPAKESPLGFRMYAAADCKSLYDAVRQATPALEEKRCIIDVVAIRDAMAKGHLLWVPTHAQLADALTKLDRNLLRAFTDHMEALTVTLKNCEA